MATDDVITTTDDVIYIICIVLEGKLMCWNKVVCFITNSPLKVDFLELHMDILMQQLLHSYKKYAVGQSFFIPKNYFIKNMFLATILQNDRPRRSLFWL